MLLRNGQIVPFGKASSVVLLVLCECVLDLVRRPIVLLADLLMVAIRRISLGKRVAHLLALVLALDVPNLANDLLEEVIRVYVLFLGPRIVREMYLADAHEFA